jgi:hypothetical protein
LISESLQTPIRWSCLHGDGIQTVAMDMDKAQVKGNYTIIDIGLNLIYLGFGLFLSSLDPEARPWFWYTHRTIIYCSIHFQRGIRQSAGTDIYPGSIHERMIALLDCTKEDYYVICQLLIGIQISIVCDPIINRF